MVTIEVLEWGTFRIYPFMFDGMIARHLPASINDLVFKIEEHYRIAGRGLPADVNQLKTVTECLAILCHLEGRDETD